MTASSYYSASYVASKANDDDTNTLWASASSAQPRWIYVDLSSPQAVDRSQIQWRVTGIQIPSVWSLQVSNDAQMWETVKSFSSYSIASPYTETVYVTQDASKDANVSWSDNDGEDGVGSYSREYAYDKVGNRTQMHLIDNDGATDRDITWKMSYNTLNQLEFRYQGENWEQGTSGEERVSYLYDANGNLTQEKTETYSGGWSETLKWVYAWNQRDQMKTALKYVNGSGTYSRYINYRYCLSCDGTLSERIEGTLGVVESWKRYEYDGLKLLRVDERYDSDEDGLDSGDPWRTVEVSSFRPGTLGALVGKRVYTHTDNDDTPDETNDYSYAYDAVGNVAVVFDSDGNEKYFFSQDAFGNELDIAAFGSYDWASARDDGVGEHQTGKWVDPFTGKYYFHARWYDRMIGDSHLLFLRR